MSLSYFLWICLQQKKKIVSDNISSCDGLFIEIHFGNFWKNFTVKLLNVWGVQIYLLFLSYVLVLQRYLIYRKSVRFWTSLFHKSTVNCNKEFYVNPF